MSTGKCTILKKYFYKHTDKLHRVRDLVTPAVMAKYPKVDVEIDWVKGEVVMVGKGLGRRCTLYHCDEPYDLQLISDRIRVFAEQT